MGMCCLLNSDTVLGASLVLGPTIPTRFDVDAIICWAAGTASAASLRLSVEVHWTWWPRIPPAWSMTATAARHPVWFSGPNTASDPEYGSKALKVSVPFAPPPDEVAQPAPTTASTASKTMTLTRPGEALMPITPLASAHQTLPILYYIGYSMGWWSRRVNRHAWTEAAVANVA